MHVQECDMSVQECDMSAQMVMMISAPTITPKATIIAYRTHPYDKVSVVS